MQISVCIRAMYGHVQMLCTTNRAAWCSFAPLQRPWDDKSQLHCCFHTGGGGVITSALKLVEATAGAAAVAVDADDVGGVARRKAALHAAAVAVGHAGARRAWRAGQQAQHGDRHRGGGAGCVAGHWHLCCRGPPATRAGTCRDWMAAWCEIGAMWRGVSQCGCVSPLWWVAKTERLSPTGLYRRACLTLVTYGIQECGITVWWCVVCARRLCSMGSMGVRDITAWAGGTSQHVSHSMHACIHHVCVLPGLNRHACLHFYFYLHWQHASAASSSSSRSCSADPAWPVLWTVRSVVKAIGSFCGPIVASGSLLYMWIDHCLKASLSGVQ